MTDARPCVIEVRVFFVGLQPNQIDRNRDSNSGAGLGNALGCFCVLEKLVSDSRRVTDRCRAQLPLSRYYKFARGGLCLACDDVQFADRFRFLFAECVSSQAELDGLQVFVLELTTNHSSNTSLISFSADEGVEYCTFILELFPERNFRVLPDKKLEGWRYLAAPDGANPVIAVGRNQLLVHRNCSWQAIIAQFAVSNVMRLQQDVQFFHAATVGIRSNGVFITGAKEAGKTTLSLALAARSHAFLGDEYAAVCVRPEISLHFGERCRSALEFARQD